MRLEAIILDWAGTTVDFGCFAPVEAFIRAFRHFGITPSLEEVRRPMGMLKHDHIAAMLGMPRIAGAWEKIYGMGPKPEDVDAVYQMSEKEILAILKDYASPKPGVLEGVAACRAKGLKIGSTTGYTDEMMTVVVSEAEKQGYAPDCWFSPDAVGSLGRPYPYMIFKNLEKLAVSAVSGAIKVGDTVSDIHEGKAAGLLTVGIVDGSSIMGLSQEVFSALSDAEKQSHRQRTIGVYQKAGADYIIEDFSRLIPLLERIESQK
ncbi:MULTISPECIES: phosphonoacetaldehyde hydrolase [Eubacterium]|uniref:Phosphonoacetaldehyde hydrolase n=1 Tax=Eubacterium barkeri TaxID=1528 RepID=A0A1H3CMD3_EUBBA|nr:phosphonoacetaldehyde hydrolase [Eubacterium barkeri]SDX55277.1 phosphonoacetaldehyde hydrolase [Eubacterium barkeri]